MPDSAGAKSFGTIVPLYASAMLRVAAALIGPVEAEDAVQEASMRAWQSWATLRNVDAVRPWLLRITVNVCREWRRGLKGYQQAHLHSLPADPDTDPTYRPLLAMLEADPGTSNHAGELDLRAAVNALPTDLRIVVALRFYAGLDATEIGEVLSIPAGTVRSRLHRALVQMRERLQPSGLSRTTHPQMEGRP
jgi:RNA polymerase sigma-70 factor (ECF subfamily)